MVGSALVGQDKGGHVGRTPKVGYPLLHEGDGVLALEKFLGAFWCYGEEYRTSRS